MGDFEDDRRALMSCLAAWLVYAALAALLIVAALLVDWDRTVHWTVNTVR